MDFHVLLQVRITTKRILLLRFSHLFKDDRPMSTGPVAELATDGGVIK